MTAIQFQNSPELQEQLKTVLETPVMKLALEILAEEAPVRDPIHASISPTYASVRLGYQTGWHDCARLLTKTLLSPPDKQEAEPEADYSEPKVAEHE